MTVATAGAAGARVTLRRDHADDVQHRQVYARIDSGETLQMRFGDTVAIDTEPGPHVLKVNNTLYWKTCRFSLEPGEQAEFVLVNRVSRFGFGALALLGVGPLRLTIERTDKS
jgi:hypothetical protein